MASSEWEVLTADYIGNGKWESNTPLMFGSEAEAAYDIPNRYRSHIVTHI